MKFFKKFIIIAFALFLINGVSGCMDKKEEYKELILNKLEERYNKEFEISKLYYEFNGNDFNYYRAICNAVGEEESFEAYYYLDGNDSMMDEEESFYSEGEFKDGYVLLKLQNDNVKKIKSQLSVESLVYNELTFDGGNSMPTLGDYQNGLEYCLTSSSYNVDSVIYIFMDNSILNKHSMEENLINNLINKDTEFVSLNIVYVDNKYFDYIEEKYGINCFDMSSSLKEDDKVNSFSMYVYNKFSNTIDFYEIKGE